ncbi:hypothetical protein [Methylocella sp.]|uniref:hypothetical protein n=1 Tax=Methylocella sp. TaxID=1978226 RepID=UPI0037838013
MNAMVKTAAAASMFSAMFGAPAWAEEKNRDAAIEKCWMEAHKEYPTDSGNDVNTSGLARDAYFHYAACMQDMGFKP